MARQALASSTRWTKELQNLRPVDGQPEGYPCRLPSRQTSTRRPAGLPQRGRIVKLLTLWLKRNFSFCALTCLGQLGLPTVGQPSLRIDPPLFNSERNPALHLKNG